MPPEKQHYKTGSTRELLIKNLICRFCDARYRGFECSPCPYCGELNAGDIDPVAATKRRRAKINSLQKD